MTKNKLFIKLLSEQLTSAQVFSTFKKEVIAFFIKDIDGFEVVCDLKVEVFEQDLTEPSGFSKYKIGDQNIDSIYDNSPKSMPFKIFQKYKKKTRPAIFKVRIFALSKVTMIDLENLFDKYRQCELKLFSNALDREFDIGDGDDSGAVTIHKKFSGYHVDIWIRSFND